MVDLLMIGRITKPHNQYVQPKKRPAPNLRYPGDDAIHAFVQQNGKSLGALSKKYNIARETARRWLLKSGVLDKDRSEGPDQGGMFHVTRSVLGRRHNGDLAAIRAEVESSTVFELATRYAISAGTVSGWVFKLGVQASKVCGRCRKRRLAAEMARRADGFASNICQECEDEKTLKHRARVAAYKAKKSAEAERKEAQAIQDSNNSDIAILALRWKMSGQSGYYNMYAKVET